MLVDEAKITVKAGHGGPGKVSFFPGLKSGPDGGNGGRGGNVYLKGTTDLMALRPFTISKTVAAENGQMGESFQKTGRDGKDITVLIPLGSEIKDLETGETIDIDEDGLTLIIAEGGLGGKGNFELRSSRNTTPMRAQQGLPGQERKLEIQLKLIADFGLIGLPNAGKSSLLNELTAATPKIADYPFTTLEPNLGVFEKKILADIPGLIEGASSGKGLGIKFLKHIEKTKVLLHCISAESDDVVRDYQTIRQELEKYNSELLKKEEIILLTKSDAVDQSELKVKNSELKKLKKKVLVVSIHDWDSLEQLKKLLSN
jgi:GTP-binding protein